MFRSICFLCLPCSLFLLLAQVPSAPAQSEFKKALQAKYDFKSVSCYACHMRKSEVGADQEAAFEENGKAFRNAFGKAFDKHLQGKEVTKRLAAVKELDSDDPKKLKVKEEVTQDFLEALTIVETEKSPSGPTYGELLKQAMLDGVKPK